MAENVPEQCGRVAAQMADTDRPLRTALEAQRQWEIVVKQIEPAAQSLGAFYRDAARSNVQVLVRLFEQSSAHSMPSPQMVASICRLNETMTAMFSGLSEQVANAIGTPSVNWLSEFQPFVLPAIELSGIREALLIHSSKLKELNFVSEGILLSIQSIARLTPPESAPANLPIFTNGLQAFMDSYCAVFRSLAESSLGALSCSPTVSGFATRELFCTADSASQATGCPVKPQIVERTRAERSSIGRESEERLPHALAGIKPDFASMWKGALGALGSGNPEAPRHFAISARELMTHLIHHLAPDERVKNWAKDKSHFDRNGRPTRRARLLYISNPSGSSAFGNFVAVDVEELLRLFDGLQTLTHSVSRSPTSDQLEAYRTRAQSAIWLLACLSPSSSAEGEDGVES